MLVAHAFSLTPQNGAIYYEVACSARCFHRLLAVLKHLEGLRVALRRAIDLKKTSWGVVLISAERGCIISMIVQGFLFR